MFSSAELEILLRARDEASRVLQNAETRFGKFTRSLDRFVRPALLATTISTSALIGAVGLFVRAAMEGEVANARLETSIKATGIAFDEDARQKIETFVKSLENMTGFSDNEVRDALATLILETGDLEESMIRVRIAADFARGAKIDLGTAARLLGKITDETVNVLARYGIKVDENTTATELFALVQARFAGQAATFADTIEGKWAKVQNRFRDFLETTGAALLPYLDKVLDKVEEWEASELPKISATIADFVAKNPQVIAAGGAFLTASVGLMALAAAGALLGAVLGSPLVALGLVAIAASKVWENVELVRDNWDKMGEALRRGDLTRLLGQIPGPLGNTARAFGELAQRIQAVYDIWMRLQAASSTAVNPGPNYPQHGGLAGPSTVTGVAASSSDRPATLDDMYAAYVRNHGSTPPDSWYSYAQSLLSMGPMWSEVQGMAEGGIGRARPGGTLVRIGEGGRDEAVVPLPPGWRGGGLGETHVHFHGPVYGMEHFREVVNGIVRSTATSGGYRGVLESGR